MLNASLDLTKVYPDIDKTAYPQFLREYYKELCNQQEYLHLDDWFVDTEISNRENVLAHRNDLLYFSYRDTPYMKASTCIWEKWVSDEGIKQGPYVFADQYWPHQGFIPEYQSKYKKVLYGDLVAAEIFKEKTKFFNQNFIKRRRTIPPAFSSSIHPFLDRLAKYLYHEQFDIFGEEADTYAAQRREYYNAHVAEFSKEHLESTPEQKAQFVEKQVEEQKEKFVKRVLGLDAEEKHPGHVYALFDSRNEICYIGSTQKTVRDRFLEHLSFAENHRGGPFLYTIIRQEGVENITYLTLWESPACTREELERIEHILIATLQPRGNGYGKDSPFTSVDGSKWDLEITRTKI